MAFVLSEEQNMLKETAKDFCTRSAPISQLRRLRDERNALGYDRDTWNEIVQLGWPGIPFAEEYGGLGFGYHGLGVVMEEMGRTLAASPLFSTVLLAGTAIERGGSEAQKQDLLPRIAGGEIVMALALEEKPFHVPYGTETKAAAVNGGFRISGRKVFVIDGHVADKLVVVARTSGEAGERAGLTLFLVDGDAKGLTRERTFLADNRNSASLVFKDADISPEDVLGEVGGAADILDPVLDIGCIGVAAEMLGLSQEAFERTIQYLKDRVQFDVPIGSFQGLKHRAAWMFCEIELAKSAVWDALSALDEGRPDRERARLASLAKAKAGDAAELITREAIQMHGGIGMTDEFDIGLFMKRAAVCEQVFGDKSFHRNRYAELGGY